MSDIYKKSRPMSRTIPDFILDQILGKDKMMVASTRTLKSGDPAQPRSMMKKTVMKRGREAGGPINPRGGRYKSETLRDQLDSGVGTHPEEGPSSRYRNLYNENVVKKEKRKDFPDAQAYPKLAEETINQIGRDTFLKMPYTQAAEILGIKGGMDENAYATLKPNQKSSFWTSAAQDMKRAPIDILNEVRAATTPVATNRDPELVPQDDIKAQILKEMLGDQ